MNQKISPAVAVVLAIVIAALVGVVSFKKFGTPDGVQGKIPASAFNHGGGSTSSGPSTVGPPSTHTGPPVPTSSGGPNTGQ